MDRGRRPKGQPLFSGHAQPQEPGDRLTWGPFWLQLTFSSGIKTCEGLQKELGGQGQVPCT